MRTLLRGACPGHLIPSAELARPHDGVFRKALSALNRFLISTTAVRKVRIQRLDATAGPRRWSESCPRSSLLGSLAGWRTDTLTGHRAASWARRSKSRDNLFAIPFEFSASPDLVADIDQSERDACQGQCSHWPSDRIHCNPPAPTRNFACLSRRATRIYAEIPPRSTGVL